MIGASLSVQHPELAGLILQVTTADIARYRSPEKILSDPSLAANLAAPSILVDPTLRLVLQYANDPASFLGNLFKVLSLAFAMVGALVPIIPLAGFSGPERSCSPFPTSRSNTLSTRW